MPRLKPIAARSPPTAGTSPTCRARNSTASSPPASPSGAIDDGARLAGVMGLQHVRDVDLIRHAYVLPKKEGCNIGNALLHHIRAMNTRPMWSAPGRSASTNVTALRSFRRRARPCCSNPTGASRSARSRRQSCWPILRKWLRAPSPRLWGEGRDEGASRLRSACGQALTARFAHDPRIKSGGRFSPRARGEVTMPRHSAPCR